MADPYQMNEKQFAQMASSKITQVYKAEKGQEPSGTTKMALNSIASDVGGMIAEILPQTKSLTPKEALEAVAHQVEEKVEARVNAGGWLNYFSKAQAAIAETNPSAKFSTLTANAVKEELTPHFSALAQGQTKEPEKVALATQPDALREARAAAKGINVDGGQHAEGSQVALTASVRGPAQLGA